MKSVSESLKEVETKKGYLQEQVDQLNEDCARLKAQGICTPYDMFVWLLASELNICNLQCQPTLNKTVVKIWIWWNEGFHTVHSNTV